MSSRTSALVLAGSINSATIEPTPGHRRASAPRYEQMENRYEPLDLEATLFRYLLPHRCDRTLTSRARRRR